MLVFSGLRAALGKRRHALGLAIAATATIAVTSWLVYLVVGDGQILVSISARGAVPIKHLDVFVDGKKVDCTGVPCAVPGQPRGLHAVEVSAEGFAATPTKSVEVQARGSAMVSFVLDALPSLGLKVAGTQPGAVLSIDDREVGELPQWVRGLALGTHEILVSAGDNYQSIERSIELEPGKLTDLGVIKLKVLIGKLTILPGQIVADEVTLHRGSDRQELRQLPITLSVVADDHWTITASKRGYARLVQSVNFDDGEREKTYTLNFTRLLPRDPTVPGVLTAEQVRTTAARYTPSVKRACWQTAFDTRNAGAASSARVVVTVSVATDGSVVSASSSPDPPGYHGLADCVAARVRGWTFPFCTEPTTFNLPFAFGFE